MKKKKLAVGILCAMMCLGCAGSAGAADAAVNPMPQAQSNEDDGISPQSEEIIWVVKKVNGKWYRRLFNTTTGEYIGNWIPCE